MDQSSRELIQKFIKANYINIHKFNNLTEFFHEHHSQSWPLSFTLCGIYFQSLDKFILNYLNPRWTKKIRCFINKKHYHRKKHIQMKNLIIKMYPQLNKTVIDTKKRKLKKHDKTIHITRWASRKHKKVIVYKFI